MDVMHEVVAALIRYRPAGPGAAAPTAEARLEEVGLNSGEVVEVILDLEDRYRIVVDATEISRTTTVRELADYVSAKVAARRGPGGA